MCVNDNNCIGFNFDNYKKNIEFQYLSGVERGKEELEIKTNFLKKCQYSPAPPTSA